MVLFLRKTKPNGGIKPNLKNAAIVAMVDTLRSKQTQILYASQLRFLPHRNGLYYDLQYS